MRLVSWNVNHLDVGDWLAGTGADLALLQAGDITADAGEPRVSRPGTLTAATVVIDGGELRTAVSVYAPRERPLGRDAPIWADASAHRLLLLYTITFCTSTVLRPLNKATLTLRLVSAGSTRRDPPRDNNEPAWTRRATGRVLNQKVAICWSNRWCPRLESNQRHQV